MNIENKLTEVLGKSIENATNEELYMLNHWSNFQPLCSKVNRWEKKGNVQSLCNIELNITVYSKEHINLD